MGDEELSGPDMLRVKVNWTGFVGGPGYTNLYFDDPAGGFHTQEAADAVVAATDIWLDAWASSIPVGTSILVDPTVESVHDTSGDMYAFWSTVPDGVRAGASAGGYSAAAGACVNWYTNGIRNGRRIRGRTFMVPLGGSALDATGTIDNTKLGIVRTATETFLGPVIGAVQLGVWSRPSLPGVEDGEWHATTAYTIPDKTAVLTSRRD